jgi:hypothetical protein
VRVQQCAGGGCERATPWSRHGPARRTGEQVTGRASAVTAQKFQPYLVFSSTFGKPQLWSSGSSEVAPRCVLVTLEELWTGGSEPPPGSSQHAQPSSGDADASESAGTGGLCRPGRDGQRPLLQVLVLGRWRKSGRPSYRQVASCRCTPLAQAWMMIRRWQQPVAPCSLVQSRRVFRRMPLQLCADTPPAP